MQKSHSFAWSKFKLDNNLTENKHLTRKFAVVGSRAGI